MEEFGQEFLDIMKKLQKLTSNRMIPQNTKIYHGEYMILMAIYHLSLQKEETCCLGVRVGEISRYMNSGKSTTSKMLRCVEEKGYIERVNDTKDRRNVYVRLTKKGETIIFDAQSQLDEFTKKILGKLGTEDASNLIRIMKKMYKITQEEVQNSLDKKEE